MAFHRGPCGIVVLLTAAVLVAAPAEGRETPRVERLTTEYATEPLGIDIERPRLAWVADSGGRDQAQTAYQIQVASSAQALRAGRADVWDSGTVRSTTVQATYAGRPLRSATRYHWRARVWNADGRASSWSRPAWWETGLLEDSDWDAGWIRPPLARDWGDFRLETTLTVTRDALGVLFRADGGGNGYLWQLVQGSRLRMNTVADGVVTPLAEIPVDHVIPPDQLLNHPHQLVIEADGRTLRTTLDGSMVDTRTDATFASGEVGVRAVAAERGTMDELRVRGLDGETLFAEDFSGARPWRAGRIENGVLSVRGPVPSEGEIAFPVEGNPQLRREFTLDKPVERARVYVSGLGYHELALNGDKVGDHVLDPAWVDFTERAFYVTHDVTSQLRRGTNAIGVAIGGGWFRGLVDWGQPRGAWDGRPRLRLRLVADHRDGSSTVVTTDGRWTTSEGPTTTSTITPDAERYDARRESPGWTTAGFDDAGWRRAASIDPPPAELRAQPHEPIRVTGTHQALAVTEPTPGVHVYDFGRTMAGWARLRVAGPAGSEVGIRYGERLGADGRITAPFTSIRDRRDQYDTYVLRGGSRETWEPRFTYKGFRYVEITGYPGIPGRSDVVARRVHSDVETTGQFTSSDTLLNRIHELTASTELDNHQSVPTDGIEQEKLPWIDAGRMTDSTFMNFGLQRLYRKWMDDVRDSQDDAGNVAAWAPQPDPGFRPPSPGWGNGYVYTAWNLYRYYGDREVLTEFYPSLARYVDFELGRLDARGLTTDQWGDWAAPTPATAADNTVIATSWVHYSAKLVSRMAATLGHEADAEHYRAAAAEVASSINAAFFDGDRGRYLSAPGAAYRQGNNVLPLAFGIVPRGEKARVAASIAADVEERGDHLNTGSVGTKWLLRVLTEHGYADVAHRVATQTTYPSWGFWIANDATAMWENWGLGSRGRSHWHLAAVDDWLYQDLAGVEPAAPGYERVRIAPHAPAGLHEAGAEVETVRGRVASRWRKLEGGRLRLDATIPFGTTADVEIPTSGVPSAVLVDGRVVWNGERGTQYGAHADGDRIVLEGVGSGTRAFESRPLSAPASSLDLRVEPAAVTMAAGTSRTFTVSLAGRTATATAGAFTADAPEGWTVDPESAPFELEGGSWPTATTAALRVTAPGDAQGDHTIAFVAETQDGVREEAQATVTVPSLEGTVQVSDLPWLSEINGWGPVERDRANGEQAAGDGPPLALDGRVYEKGVGAHARSEIVLALDGRCGTFAATVGVDDSRGGNGSITFQVLADGEEVASTPVVTGASPAIDLVADVTGADRLTLRVTDGGNGIGNDHGDWADARLVCRED